MSLLSLCGFKSSCRQKFRKGKELPVKHIRAIGFALLSILLYLISAFLVARSDLFLAIQSNLGSYFDRDSNETFGPRYLYTTSPYSEDQSTETTDNDDKQPYTLFGAITSLKVIAGTVSVLIIVVAVHLTEFVFHLLHEATNDTPFASMAQIIEKELMGVGFTAFCFKILLNTTSFLDAAWFHGIDYADLMVPLFSFAYCGLGIVLILNSLRISTMWSQAYHLTLTQMLDDYYKLPGFVGYLTYGVWLAPITPAIARVEFRIFQNIFCETYKIQKTAFAFNEYVEKVFEKYVLTIIKIRWSDWAVLCTLVLLNWARNELHWDIKDCDQQNGACEKQNNTSMFAIAGAVICGMTFFMALESRRLEVSIMRQKGIRSIHMYPSYLKYMEESEEAEELDKFRLSKEELKVSAEGVKYSAINSDLLEQESCDQEFQSARLIDQLKHSVPGLSISIAPDKYGHPSPKPGNNFGATVKKAWKSKKQVGKRRRSVNVLGDTARMAARRTSMIGGMGFPNLAHLAALQAKYAESRAAAGAIEEGDEESASDSSSDGLSSASASQQSSGSDSGSEVFDPYAPSKHKKDKKQKNEKVESHSDSNSEVKTSNSIEDTHPREIVPKRLPPIGLNRWKAAPAPHHHSLPHVFSRIQKHMDAVIGSSSSRNSNPAGFYRESGDFTQEDSKLSWIEGSGALRKKQLPPIRAAPSVNSLKERLHVDASHSDATASPLSEQQNNRSNIAIGAEAKRFAPRGAQIVLNTYSPEMPKKVVSESQNPEPLTSSSRKVRKSGNASHNSKSGSPELAKSGPRVSGRGSGIARLSGTSSKSTGATASVAVMPSRNRKHVAAVDTTTATMTTTESAAALPQPSRPYTPAIGPALSAPSAEEDEEVQETAIADVFFLSWPELYLEGVQSLIMIIAFYTALYFTNFASAAGSDGWKFLTFLPILICTLLLIYVVKSAVMLGAIHAVDCDAILEVLEQTEGARILSELIKEKVIGLLSEMGPDPQAELVNLFSEIDSDGSGSISRDEFAEYMNSIEIHFDRRRWMQVFRGIDTSFDNKITFEEFYVFLFPDHMLGQAMQQRKEKALKNHLKRKSAERADLLKRFSHGDNTHLTFVPQRRPPSVDIEQGRFSNAP